MTSVPSGVSASFSARWIWSGPPATGTTGRTEACNMTTSPAETPSRRKPSARSCREYIDTDCSGRTQHAERGTRDAGPGTRDAGPGTKDAGLATRDQGLLLPHGVMEELIRHLGEPAGHRFAGE